MRFGDAAVNQRVYHEQWVQTQINANCPNLGQEHIFNVGSFTMPFAGHAMVNMWAAVHWPETSGCFIAVSMAAQSTPTRTATVDNVLTDGIPPGLGYTCKNDQPSHAYWANLAAGQVVQMKARLWVAYVVPYFEWCLCLVRMWRP
jgi:hypothetical protein